MRGLFLGRFQPFHVGHFDGVRSVLNDCASVLIVIASAHICHTASNPFTGGERYDMIKATMLAEGIAPERYDIIPVGFYHSTPDFLASVVSLSPPFQHVYTANPQIVSLFSSWNYHIASMSVANVTSGTQVRRKMAAAAPWEHLVPEAVMRVIQRIDGVKRLQTLCADDSAHEEGETRDALR